MRKLKLFVQFVVVCLPWKLRRTVLTKFYKYEIAASARIGFSWVFPKTLEMAAHSQIGHLNVAINLDAIQMEEHSKIGRRNWITGFPSTANPRHFKHTPNRQPRLRMGAHSAITKNHHIDCTDEFSVGRFTTIAGYFSQFLTHSIDVVHNRQSSLPISIGDYCFVGTNVVVLGGASLPNHCVLGAKSMLNKAFSEQYHLYAGVPAQALSPLPQDSGYFQRAVGFVE